MQLPGQHLEERAFARAVRADQAAKFQFGQGKIHRIDGRDAAEAHRCGAGFEQWHAGHARLSTTAAAAGVDGRRLKARAISAVAAGTTPCGTSSTKPTRIAPSSRLASKSLLPADAA